MLVVKKFGGSSVADKAGMLRAARRCAKEWQDGNDVIVVVSAMGKTTDTLVAQAYQMSPSPEKRELDMLLCAGEQSSAALLAMVLWSLRVPAISLTAFQVQIHTSSEHGNARVEAIDRERIEQELRAGKVVVVTGFQGVDAQGDYTTLGRGGSDTTAVALAAAFAAEKCEIYTDVEGVYDADPRVDANAKKLAVIDYDEMLARSLDGAKVLHSRSVELAKQYGIELIVRSSFTDAKGTRVKRIRTEKEENR